MVPFGLNEEQFVTRYRRCLDRASRHLIGQLRELFAHSVPDTVIDAEVQIFIGDDGIEIPSAWIYYRGENNKVDHRDPSIFPGRALELSVGLNNQNMDAFDETYFTDEEFDGVSLKANCVKTWLAECWWKAGGWNYPVPVELRVHDDFGDGKAIVLSEGLRHAK